MILRLIYNKIKSSTLAIYSLFGITFAIIYLWVAHKFKKLNEAKEVLRVKDFVIDQQKNIIEEQQQQTKKVDNVKEFYEDLRTKLDDFTE